MAKLSYLQENHILIPKDGKRKDEKMLVGQNDDEYMNNLQEEVRKLHFMLKQKETIIERLKQAITSDDQEEPSKSLQMKKINSLLDKDEMLDKDSK